MRVRFACEHELDRHRRVVDERGEGIDVAEHQRGALVGGEAAGEADGQGIEAQGPAHRGDDFRRLAAALRLLGGAAAHGVDELHLQRLVRFPQLAIVDGVDAIPERGVAGARGPVGTEVAVVDLAHLRREPGRHVDAVGDVADRHAVFAAIGIQGAPHRARHFAVQRGDGVGAVAGPEREDGHAEVLVGVRHVHAAETQEAFTVEAERFAKRPEVLLDESRREPVVPGRNRRMRGEDHLRRHAPERFPRVDALDHHPLADELERGEGAVSFVQVQYAGCDAKRRERADAADAEQQLLADADALVAAVEPRRQLAILGLVAVDVRIEEEQRVAADR